MWSSGNVVGHKCDKAAICAPLFNLLVSQLLSVSLHSVFNLCDERAQPFSVYLVDSVSHIVTVSMRRSAWPFALAPYTVLNIAKCEGLSMHACMQRERPICTLLTDASVTVLMHTNNTK